jgi:hypothetical protein
MPLHSLIPSTDGGGRPKYTVMGDFNKMMYFCPDIRFNSKDKGSKDKFIEKTEEQLSTELRNHLNGLSAMAFSWHDKKLISDYWLVVTPLVCDGIQSNMPEFIQPEPRNNYIVTPFYTSDVDLVDLIFKKVPGGFGTAEQRSDPRRRRGTDAEIGVYLACEINEEGDFFEDLKSIDKNSKEYKEKFGPALLRAELELGEAAADCIKDKVRAFIQYGTDSYGIRFVEQYFGYKVSKKTNSYSLGEGYVRNRFAKVNLDKNEKHAVFHDLFGSAGYQFADYALSKEDLKEKLAAFEEKPWIELDEK